MTTLPPPDKGPRPFRWLSILPPRLMTPLAFLSQQIQTPVSGLKQLHKLILSQIPTEFL